MKRWNYYLFCVATMSLMLLCAYWGSRVVTVISEELPFDRKHCIVIDPGHGGEDGGATSCTGRMESEYNLAISRRLDDLLHLLGYQTRMTRTSDVSIYTTGSTIAEKKVSDLKERVRIVNETSDALLISIHQNQFSDSRYSGAQVFYAKTDGSKELGCQLQSKLVAAVNPGSNRKSKPISGVYLMENIRCTGILVECGFLSNAQEEAKLRDGDYQKKLCCVIAAAVSQHLSNT
ncbi:MAG: N-acetylmuramoyl-L-alanine amidase [Eubacteriales bacterium]|nr:N-acetylmuramoyl-L-alanine amidase [Eubacteriales bacterium]